MENGKKYQVNECFYSVQGEGMRVGTPNIFIRFSGCNMECDVEPGPKSPGGFACDTEFTSGRSVTMTELGEWMTKAWEQASGETWKQDGGIQAGPQWKRPWVILTGGEPGLQVDQPLINFFHDRRIRVAIETNGSIELPVGGGLEGPIDWITLSPKVAEHAVKQKWCHEIKYVRGDRKSTRLNSSHRL